MNMTALFAAFTLLFSFFQNQTPSTAPSVPMTQEYIAAVSHKAAFSATLDWQKVVSPELLDTFSMMVEAAHVSVLRHGGKDAQIILPIADALLLKQPQYLSFLLIDETKEQFIAALQVRDAIENELVDKLAERITEGRLFCPSPRVLVYLNTPDTTADALSQKDILPDGVYCRICLQANEKGLIEPVNDLLKKSPLSVLSSAQFIGLSLGNDIAVETRFANSEAATQTAVTVNETCASLRKAFANYPITLKDVEGIALNADANNSAVSLRCSYAAMNAAIAFLGKHVGKPMTRPRHNSLELACVNNVKQLMLCIIMYADDHDNVLPKRDTWKEDLKDYYNNEKLLSCNAAKAADKTYRYVLNGQKLSDFKTPSKTIVFYEDVANHPSKTVIGFLDGHVEMVELNGAITIEELAQKRQFILTK